MENNLCQNAIIFKIIDNTNNDCYITYSLGTIDDKMQQLKYDYNTHKNKNRPFTLKTIFENNDYKTESIEILENAPEIKILSAFRQALQNNNCINYKKYVGLSNEVGKKDAKKICSQKFRQRHKDEIREHKSKRILCECGAYVTNCHLSRHKKTNKHIKNLKS